MSRLLPRAAAGDHLVVHLLYLGGRRYRSSKPAKSQCAAALVWIPLVIAIRANVSQSVNTVSSRQWR
jgi:hypothetical protein